MFENLTSNEKVKIMKEFTEAYKAHSDKSAAVREAVCLRVQFPAAMMKIVPGDLFAGRYAYFPIGFTPQSPEGVGYYISMKECNEILKDKALSLENKSQMEALIDFWSTENTSYKTRQQFYDLQKKYLPSDDLYNNSGAAFPLYRMSGSQLDLDKLLTMGVPGLMQEIEANYNKNEQLFEAMRLSVELLIDICLAYRDMATAMAGTEKDEALRTELIKMAEALKNITETKPKSFREAIQLAHIYILLADSRNYGRLDEYLGDFYVEDMKKGVITEEYALKLLESFWRLIISRNMPHDSRIVIGGKGRRNEKNADKVAILAMEASRRVKDVAPQLTLRFYDGQNPCLYSKALEVIGEGTTFPMLYNDDVNIPSVQKAFEVDYIDAENYIPYGCGEYVLYHKSFGTPSGLINVLQVLQLTLRNGVDPLTKTKQGIDCGNINDFETFEDLFTAFEKQVEFFTELLGDQEKLEYDICGREAAFLYLSMLYDDCMEKGKAIFSGGLKYLGGTLESYGNINAADSLTAIKYHLYDKKDISKHELMQALDADFQGFEHVQRLLLQAPKYGNDDDYADETAKRLHESVCSIIRNQKHRTGLHNYMAVIINNSFNTTLGLNTGASPDGRLARTFMANANNPMGGMDKNGITAMLNSLVKLDTAIHAGAVQNIKFSKEMFRELLPKTKSILQTYFQMGGAQAMISVVGREDLENALKAPELYTNLIVRVGGFSARFIDLPPEVQREVLSRTIY